MVGYLVRALEIPGIPPPYYPEESPVTRKSSYQLRRLLLLAAASPGGAEESKFEPEGPMGNLCKPRQRIHSERKSSSCKANGYAYGGDVVVKRTGRGKRVKRTM